ncbi:mercuric transporter MerT family protein [Croceicoccus naphthovorans]|uniref:mercuric transporter MerT family protein n=1 Tax=Croceicoccus naphthovorans TaxID=1348774 RepID=UPI001FE1ECA5|nr:mercuric transporter MerT family protein [Croceicoccus naphthovorans]
MTICQLVLEPVVTQGVHWFPWSIKCTRTRSAYGRARDRSRRYSPRPAVLPAVIAEPCISGAWIGNLTALEPYKWVFIAIAVVFLALGFRHVYFRQAEPAKTEHIARGPEQTCSSKAPCGWRPYWSLPRPRSSGGRRNSTSPVYS